MRGKRYTVIGASPETIQAWLFHLKRGEAMRSGVWAEDIDLLPQVKRAISANGLSLRVRTKGGRGRRPPRPRPD
jgi:hypothetical protein